MAREASLLWTFGRGVLAAGTPVRFTAHTVRRSSIVHSLLTIDAFYTVASSAYHLGAIRVRLLERPGFSFLRTMFESPRSICAASLLIMRND